jgi:hypothetical protein
VKLPHIVLLTLVIAPLIALGVYLWRRWRRLRRELAESEKQADDLAALLALEHDTNYKMACQMYGKAAVDRVISKARAKGVS